jgi:cysteine desulfurase/selenocysteine lyase
MSLPTTTTRYYNGSFTLMRRGTLNCKKKDHTTAVVILIKDTQLKMETTGGGCVGGPRLLLKAGRSIGSIRCARPWWLLLILLLACGSLGTVEPYVSVPVQRAAAVRRSCILRRFGTVVAVVPRHSIKRLSVDGETPALPVPDVLRDSAVVDVARDFPILAQEVECGKKLIYLDSAASSHMPTCVKDAIINYWGTCHSNVNRGSHRLSACATERYENARKTVQQFINAKSPNEIVFTSGATHAINLVSNGWAMHQLTPGDEILLTVMEHHSNIIPWQIVAARSGATLKYAQLRKDDNLLDMVDFRNKLSSKTKLVAVAHVSNVLGCANPINDIIQAAHDVGARVLVDGCQGVGHCKVDVQASDADFYVASGHKMCGPTGVGFLYAKEAHLQAMVPVFGGGGVADEVTLSTTKYLPPPHRLEAGTPAIAEVVGLDSACRYLESVEIHKVHEHCKRLGQYMYDELVAVPDVVVYGSAQRESGIVSFAHARIHPTDLSALLDVDGICVRSGLHCAHPLHQALPFGDRGTVRASAYLYNSREDVDIFVAKLRAAIIYFSRDRTRNQ